MSIAVLFYERKSSPLKRNGIREETVEIPELSASVKKIIITAGDKLRKKQKRILEKIYLEYDNVISEHELFTPFEKRKELKTLMTATPVICLNKYLSESGKKAQTENFAIALKKASLRNKQIAVSLCKNLRFVTLYEYEKSDLSDRILEETGVCVRNGEPGEESENTVFILGNEFEIYDRETRDYFYDIVYEKKDFVKKYNLPIDKILEIMIKEYKDESYIERKNVKIMGIKSKK